MADLKLKAFLIKQSGRQFYLTSLKCEDLLDENRIRVDEWKEDLKNTPQQGYQRSPSKDHINKVSKYIAGNDISVFPTSILLNSRKKIQAASKEGCFILTINRPLWVVDGQHRIGGIKKAINELKMDEWKKIEIPAVILDDFDRDQELNQFKVINETQKGIPAPLIQWHMIQQIEFDPDKVKDFEDKGILWKVKAVKIMDQLNDKNGSPWQGRIQLPNTKKTPRHAINQNSFVTSLRPLFQKKKGFLESYKLQDASEIILNYWKALEFLFKEAFLDPNNYLVQKTPGVFSLHWLANEEIFPRSRKHFDVSTLIDILKLALPPARYKDDFWDKREGKASVYGSMKGFRRLADEFESNLPEQRINE